MSEIICKDCGHTEKQHGIGGCCEPDCPCRDEPRHVRAFAEIARLNSNLDEWQRVGEIIQQAATGKPGQLSDSDVIGELERLRADNARLNIAVMAHEVAADMTSGTEDVLIAQAKRFSEEADRLRADNAAMLTDFVLPLADALERLENAADWHNSDDERLIARARAKVRHDR